MISVLWRLDDNRLTPGRDYQIDLRIQRGIYDSKIQCNSYTYEHGHYRILKREQREFALINNI